MRSLLLSVLLLMALMTGGAAASGGFEVMKSNVTALKTGQKLSAGASIKLPAGGEVTLIDRTGATASQKICAGAYDGPVKSCPGKQSCTVWERLTGKCAGGGPVVGGQRSPVTGGMRGATPEPKQ